GQLSWKPIDGAVQYLVYKDGKLIAKTQEPAFRIAGELTAEYKVSAIDADGFESFTSEPVMANALQAQVLEMEQFGVPSRLPYVNFTGTGFLELSNEANKVITWTVEVKEAGRYLLDFRYSNGSGPWNTDNKCALRSLYINEMYTGSMVFPQRGKDEWSEWGYSNARIVALNAGKNTFRLALEPWNTNMNVEVNTAMLDALRLLRMP
ncbi:MAG TPA: hypothetical protein VLL95_02885, partial [Phnomibacter sp.]|nr:hypothetical protein [Phnomibacter sp.]